MHSIHYLPQGSSWEDYAVIGFDEEANTVIERLVKESKDLVIIPMVGVPGLGKTTLARKIYDDPKLSYEFFSMVWVYVGQDYKIKNIYLNILRFFTKRIEEYQNKEVDELAYVISGFISKGGKCLIF